MSRYKRGDIVEKGDRVFFIEKAFETGYLLCLSLKGFNGRPFVWDIQFDHGVELLASEAAIELLDMMIDD